ncbi:DUF559 domain-containing protein [Actinomycetes bacterium KLBMP 9797]
MDLYDQARRLPWQLTPTASLVTYQDLREAGATENAIRWRVDGHGLSRLQRGIYLQGGAPPALLDRIYAALLAAPPHAVLGCHTAAQLYGFGVTPTDTVHLLIPAGAAFPQRSGITVHRVVLPIGEPVEVFGLPCAPPERCAVDLARLLPRLDALPALDAALFSEACPHEALLAEVARHDGLRGIRQARELVPLADARAECRQESQMRLVLHDAGIRGLIPQVPVLDDQGVERHRIDLADERTRVGIEYDGASHLDRRRMRRDRLRHNWLESRGWAMRYFTDHDLYTQPDVLVQVVRDALRPRTPLRDRGLTVAHTRRSRAHRGGSEINSPR